MSLTNTSSILFLMFLRAVSVLSPVPFNERLHSNLLRLAVHDELLGVSVLDVDVVGELNRK